MTDAITQEGSDQQAQPSVTALPTEIHQMILESMASIGPQEAHTALLVGPQFKAGLAKYQYKLEPLRWSQVSLFLREKGKQHNALTIDFSVNDKSGARIKFNATPEEEAAMELDKFSMSQYRNLSGLPDSYISNWDLRVTNVVLKDYYSSQSDYSHVLSFIFCKSVEHLTCIESGRNKKEKDDGLWLQYWYLDHNGPPPHVQSVFTNCKDFWLQLPSHFQKSLGVKFEFPKLEYLYMVIKAGEGFKYTLRKWLEHAKEARSLKSSNLKIAQVIQYSDRDAPAEDIKKWVESAKAYIPNDLYKQTACIAMYCPEGETLNTIEGKAKIRAACEDQWAGVETKRAAEEVKDIGPSTKKQKRK